MTGPMISKICILSSRLSEFLFFIVARHFFFCQGFPADSKGLFPSALKKFSFFLFSREIQKETAVIQKEQTAVGWLFLRLFRMIVIIIQKAMELFILLIGNNLVQMDIFHTAENILLDLWVILC